MKSKKFFLIFCIGLLFSLHNEIKCLITAERLLCILPTLMFTGTFLFSLYSFNESNTCLNQNALNLNCSTARLNSGANMVYSAFSLIFMVVVYKNLRHNRQDENDQIEMVPLVAIRAIDQPDG